MSRRGGLCFLINKNWCTDVRIISQASTSNLEFITINSDLFIFHVTFRLSHVYIHPRADTNAAVKDIHNTICMCENDNRDTLSTIAGDCNHTNLGKHNA